MATTTSTVRLLSRVANLYLLFLPRWLQFQVSKCDTDNIKNVPRLCYMWSWVRAAGMNSILSPLPYWPGCVGYREVVEHGMNLHDVKGGKQKWVFLVFVAKLLFESRAKKKNFSPKFENCPKLKIDVRRGCSKCAFVPAEHYETIPFFFNSRKTKRILVLLSSAIFWLASR